MSVVVVIGCALLGLVVGAYLNLIITRWIGWRLVVPQLLGYEPPYTSVRGAMPHCRACDAPLALGPVPLLSWTMRLGRCGRCRERLAARYLVVEVLTAGLFVAAAIQSGNWQTLALLLVLFTFLVATSTVDVVVQRIPTRFVYITHAVTIPLLFVVALSLHENRLLVGAAVGGLFFFGFLFLFHMISPRRMGFGDVRLAGVMGLYLGTFGWTPDFPITGPILMVIWGALLGSVIGTFVGFGVLIASRRNRYFPFGPGLASGTAIVVLFADQFRPGL